jgi:TldD protein
MPRPHSPVCRIVALATFFAFTCLHAAAASSTDVTSAKSTEGQDKPKDVVITAMQKELDRSFEKLKNIASSPLYFLSYALYDIRSLTLTATYGAMSYEDDSHSRVLNADARVGNKHLDNSHQMRAGQFTSPPLAIGMGRSSHGNFPLQDDEDAIRSCLWMATDREFKAAQQAYLRVKANQDVKVAEEDASDDFAEAKPVVFYEPSFEVKVDLPSWRERLRKASAIYKEFPDLSTSVVRLDVDQTRRFLVNTEGTCIEDNAKSFRVGAEASAVAKDGMIVRLYDAVEVPNMDLLPDQATLEKMVRKLCASVVVLKNTPKATPFVGPAILNAKATGVFFHEVLGHRLEGHRQKRESEGRTFATKVGELIMPTFMSVVDDPTRATFGKTPLVGYYKYDDEGVPAQKVQLVENGVLKNFLMGRSPISGFNVSNGHGRSSAGSNPVARQGNLIVESSKGVPYAKLRAMLIQEAKAQHKQYGLIIDEISGGFTLTHTSSPQSYVLLPLRVTRVYTDGRPDELTRGVNIVGTPLTSLEKILCASRDDDDTFNGRCGAESGWVPVSATGPSLLLKTIELEKEYKSQNQPPVLPAPISDSKGK